jgi:hypothetical protein
MAKKSVIERQKKRISILAKKRILREFLIGKVKASSSLNEKIFYHSLLQSLPRNSSFTRSVCFLIVFK